MLYRRSLLVIHYSYIVAFPGCSVGKESACNAGNPGLISGSERYAEDGIDYPLQYSWASLVAQLVRNCLECGRFGLPGMWEIWVQSLGWEDPLEKGTATHSSILAWRIQWNSMDYTDHGVAKSQTRLSHFHFHFHIYSSMYMSIPISQFILSPSLPTLVTITVFYICDSISICRFICTIFLDFTYKW